MNGVKIAIALLAGAGCLAGCAPEDPEPTAMTPCQHAARLVGNPYAAPGAVEAGLEFLRVKCLGVTADGSRQLRPVPSTVSGSGPGAITAQDTDETMFRKDMQAVPGQ
jgi:hypothetical protein